MTAPVRPHSASVLAGLPGLRHAFFGRPGGVSDGIYFRKLAAETGLSLVVGKNSSESTVEVIETLVADTWYVIEFYYDGSDDKIKAYVDRTGAGSVPLTNAPDDEDLALSFGFQNGSANASTLTLDFIGAQQER